MSSANVFFNRFTPPRASTAQKYPRRSPSRSSRPKIPAYASARVCISSDGLERAFCLERERRSFLRLSPSYLSLSPRASRVEEKSKKFPGPIRAWEKCQGKSVVSKSFAPSRGVLLLPFEGSVRRKKLVGWKDGERGGFLGLREWKVGAHWAEREFSC